MAHDKHNGSKACTSAVCPILLACPPDVSVLSVAVAQACASVHGPKGLGQEPGTRSTALSDHAHQTEAHSIQHRGLSKRAFLETSKHIAPVSCAMVLAHLLAGADRKLKLHMLI